jgi:thiol-disulfide isomerase/thioredoxin
MRTAGIVTLLSLSPILMAESLTGLWQGTVQASDQQVPFKFEIQGDGSSIKASFFNGEERFTSTSGQLSGDSLTLNWEYFASKLEAKVSNGALDGTYYRARSSPAAFHAVRFKAPEITKGKVPSINGLWVLENVKSSKGESAWNLIVKQKGAEVAAAILRVDGDTGTLSGFYQDGKFVLSHFSGVRPSLLEISVNEDGTLHAQSGKESMTAYRPDVARAKGLPEPTDPTQHTSMKESSGPFHFSFPDLAGKTVTDNDARFRGKVVLVNITGSWCPNCHDEAPFLAEVYKKYRAQGLEIVALSFEEGDQLKDPTRLRAFIKKYGIDYTVLLGGTTDEAKEKLSQTQNWDAWPTTFFVGRDGRVHGVHAGFPSKASGEMYAKAKAEFTEKVEHLLAENALSSR